VRHGRALRWVRADDVERAARLVGLSCLQRYLDDLTGTRTYRRFEAVTPTADARSRLAALVGEENLDQYEQFLFELAYAKVEPRRGYRIDECLSTKDLVALVRAKPFVEWYRQEWIRLAGDALLLANQAKLQQFIAEAALQRAQAAFVAAQNHASNGQLPDWQELQIRFARHDAAAELFSRATAERKAAKWASNKAALIQSAADRLDDVRSRDLAILGAALESFICREFTYDLSSVDSVAMLLFAWVKAESISCANPKCSQRFVHTSARRRRPQEYCSPACKTAAYRTREESAQVA
jgi:hypothetical protein